MQLHCHVIIASIKVALISKMVYLNKTTYIARDKVNFIKILACNIA